MMAISYKAKIHQKTESEQLRLGLRALELRKEEDMTWKIIAQRMGVNTARLRHWALKAEKFLVKKVVD